MPKANKTIEEEINHVLEEMASMDVDSEEYTAAAKNLQVLCESRSKKKSRLIEPEVLVMAATNILGILLILNYEKLGVISSKAMALVARGRF